MKFITYLAAMMLLLATNVDGFAQRNVVRIKNVHNVHNQSGSKSRLSTRIDEIELNSNIRLIISDRLRDGEIAVTSRDRVENCLNIRYSGNKAILSLRSSRNNNFAVVVSAAQVRTIIAGGTSNIEVEGRLGQLSSYRFVLRQSASARLEGRCRNLILDCSGASFVSARSLECERLSLNMNDSSRAEALVTRSMDGSMSGASMITCWAPRRIDTRVRMSGAARINWGR